MRSTTMRSPSTRMEGSDEGPGSGVSGTTLASMAPASPVTVSARVSLRFGALDARGRRQHLTWIEDPERVERRLDPTHDVDGGDAALQLEPRGAGGPDPVLAGDRPAELDREPIELVAEGVGPSSGR